MGDYDDLISGSERRIAENFEHESTIETLDSLYRNCTERLAEELSFMKGRIIGLLEGNHFAELDSGITTTHLLCEKLGCKYLGVSSDIRLLFKDRHNHSFQMHVWAMHGNTSSKKVGNSINKIEEIASSREGIDIFCMAHDHKKAAVPITKYYPSGQGERFYMKPAKRFLVRTGSFLQGYVPGKNSYVAAGGLPPADLGVVKIEATLKRRQWTEDGERKDYKYLDLHASC